MRTPDIKDEQPDTMLPIRLVGIDGVRIPAGQLRLGGLRMIMNVRFGAFIDLPPDRRGIHASRSYEPIAEVIKAYESKAFKLEDIAADIAVSLLKKHEYSRRSYVRADAIAFYEAKLPSDHTSYETFTIHAKSYATREGGFFSIRKMIGVTVTGITACPCALKSIKEICRKKLMGSGKEEDLERMMDKLPIATHTQRCKGTLLIDVSECEVDVMELVRIVSESMSSVTYELLKREDEADVVMNAIRRARFVEDVVRYMARSASELNVKDECAIIARVRSMESVHGHDMVAFLKTTAGEVRRTLALQRYK
ncbi:MAG: GTP cyclohydrolase MptA [Nitrososphaerota archaeon]|nr:GTP cyclohydrolase MptA [Aigarchaeota archaeon]MDW8076746.1 GTP cyclohydrolase MptA [Nitrososphaerota archaeon]